MTAPAHTIHRHTCPYCLKSFETAQGLKAHQRRKKHRVEDRHDGARAEKALRAYHREKVASDRRAGDGDPR